MMAVFYARYACAAVRPGPRTLPQSRARALCCVQRPRIAARLTGDAAYMPKIIKRLRNFGYRVPFLRRRFQLEDLLLVGVVVGGSFAVVVGWVLWVHWRIL